MKQRRIQLYTTAEYPCSYLPEQQARSAVVAPHQNLDVSAYSQLVQQGFRRSGEFVYRPACESCNACQSLRVPVGEFAPSRTQRRIWKRESTVLEAQLFPAHFEQEQYELYRLYQSVRHPGGNMSQDSAQQYRDFLLSSSVETFIVAFREKNDEGTHADLRMVSIVDRLLDGLSAVYTFYDPRFSKASYGTYGVLWQIALARRWGLPYAYLGYWIENCAKMRYKQDFRPHEIFRQGQWQIVKTH